MNFTSRYEFFIAHAVPGALGIIGLMLFIEDFYISGLLANIFQKLTSWEEIPFILMILLPVVLFMGLWIDGVKSVTIERLFRKWSGRISDDDYLVQMDAIGDKKYAIVLDEYYYYYESAVNCAFAVFIIMIPLSHYLWESGYISIPQCITMYVLFVLLLGTLLWSGYDHYSRFVKVMETFIKKQH